MRALRLILMGVVMLALIGGSGGVVLAQDTEDARSATHISGLRTWTDWTDDATIYEMEMTDPRANGTYSEFGFSGHEYADMPESERGDTGPGTAALGRVTLVNDDGAWTGHESAVYDPEMGWVLNAWLAGEGTYDGLTLFLHAVRDIYSTPEMSFEGVIFEGPVPHMLDAVEVPAE